LIGGRTKSALNFDDLANSIRSMRRWRWLFELIKIPSSPKKRWWRLHRWLKIDPDAAHDAQFKADERIVLGMIASMTPSERRNPVIINHSRQRRIAAGPGVTVNDVSSAVACVTNWPENHQS
jgi:signal recognition particle GTPase